MKVSIAAALLALLLFSGCGRVRPEGEKAATETAAEHTAEARPETKVPVSKDEGRTIGETEATREDSSERVLYVEIETFSEEPEAPERCAFLFAGDILLDPAYSAGASLLSGGAEGCFDAKALERMQGADVFVVNNEFAYTTRGEPASKEFRFRTDPKNAAILKDMGVDLVTLGNNHTFDYGRTGLLDTLDALDMAGIPYVGAGRNQEEAERPAVYTFGNFRVSIVNAESILFLADPPAQKAVGERAGTFDCYQPSLLYEAIRKAKTESDFCILLIHWGSEGKTTPNERQKQLAKGAAEAGADLIVGGHPHVLETISREGQVPVVYSMGNYLFHSGVQDSCLIEAVFLPAERKLETLRFVPMQCRNLRVITLEGEEKKRLLQEMRLLSPEVLIDEEGAISLP